MPVHVLPCGTSATTVVMPDTCTVSSTGVLLLSTTSPVATLVMMDAWLNDPAIELPSTLQWQEQQQQQQQKVFPIV